MKRDKLNSRDDCLARVQDFKNLGYRLGPLAKPAVLSDEELLKSVADFDAGLKFIGQANERLPALEAFIPPRKFKSLKKSLQAPLQWRKTEEDLEGAERAAEEKRNSMLFQIRAMEAEGFDVADLLDAHAAGDRKIERKIRFAQAAASRILELKSRFNSLDTAAFPKEAAKIKSRLGALDKAEWLEARIDEYEAMSSGRRDVLFKRASTLAERGVRHERLAILDGLDLDTMESWIADMEALCDSSEMLKSEILSADFTTEPDFQSELLEALSDPYSALEVEQRLRAHLQGVSEEKKSLSDALVTMGETFTGKSADAVSIAPLSNLREWASGTEAVRREAEILEAELDSMDLSLFGSEKSRIQSLLSRYETVPEAAAEISMLRAKSEGVRSSLDREIEESQAQGYSAYMLIEAASENLRHRRFVSEEYKRGVERLRAMADSIKSADTSLFAEEASAILTMLRRPEDSDSIETRWKALKARIERERSEIEGRISALEERGFDASFLRKAMERHDLFYTRNAVGGFEASISEAEVLVSRVESLRCECVEADCTRVLELLRDPSKVPQARDRIDSIEIKAESRREHILGRLSDLASRGFSVDFASLASLDLQSLEKAHADILAAVAVSEEASARLDALDTSCHVSAAGRIREMLRKPSEARGGLIAVERLGEKIDRERAEMLASVRRYAAMGYTVSGLEAIVGRSDSVHARAAILDFGVRIEALKAAREEADSIDPRLFPSEHRRLKMLSNDPGRLEEFRELLVSLRVRERARLAEIKSELASIREDGYTLPPVPEPATTLELGHYLDTSRELRKRSEAFCRRVVEIDASLFRDLADGTVLILKDLSDPARGKAALLELETAVRGKDREFRDAISAFRRRGLQISWLEEAACQSEISERLRIFSENIGRAAQMSAELEALDTSLFPTDKVEISKLLRDPMNLEKASAALAALSSRIRRERADLAARLMALADEGFVLPPIDEVISGRLGNCAVEVKRFEAAAGEARILLERIDRLDLSCFADEASAAQEAVRDLSGTDDGRKAVIRLERRVEEAFEGYRRKVEEFRRQGLVTDGLLSALSTGDHTRIRQSLASFEENLGRIRSCSFRYKNQKCEAFPEICSRIETLFGDPSRVDDLDAALFALEEKVGQAFGELSSLIGNYKSRGLATGRLDKALSGDIDTAIRTFETFETMRGRCDELLARAAECDLSAEADALETLRETLRDPFDFDKGHKLLMEWEERSSRTARYLDGMKENWKVQGFDTAPLDTKDLLPLGERKKAYAEFSESVETMRDLGAILDDCASECDARLVARTRKLLKCPGRLDAARRAVQELTKMADSTRDRIRRAGELETLLSSLDTSVFRDDRDRISRLIAESGDLEKAEASLERLVDKITADLNDYDDFVKAMSLEGYDTTRLRMARDLGESLETLRVVRQVYTSDCEHLKSLVSEVEAMDYSLFVPQVKVIVSKGKSPDLIDEVERNIGNLAQMILSKSDEFRREIAELREEGFDTSELETAGLEQVVLNERLSTFRVLSGNARAIRAIVKNEDFSPFAEEAAQLILVTAEPSRYVEAERMLESLRRKAESFREEQSFRAERLLEAGFILDMGNLGGFNLSERASFLDEMEERAFRLERIREGLEALPIGIYGDQVRELYPYTVNLGAVEALEGAANFLTSLWTARLESMTAVSKRYRREGFDTSSLDSTIRISPESFDAELADFEARVSELVRIRLRLRTVEPNVFADPSATIPGCLLDPERVSEANEILLQTLDSFEEYKKNALSGIEALRERGFVIRDRNLSELRSAAGRDEFDALHDTLKSRIARLELMKSRLDKLDCGAMFSDSARSVAKMLRDQERLEEAEKAFIDLDADISAHVRDLIERIQLLVGEGFRFEVPGGKKLAELSVSGLEETLANLQERERRILAVLSEIERYKAIPACAQRIVSLAEKATDLDSASALEEEFAALASEVRAHFKARIEELSEAGWVVDSLEASVDEAPDIVHRVFVRFENQLRHLENVLERAAALDSEGYDSDLETILGCRDPMLASVVEKQLAAVEERMKTEDEEFEFETEWFSKRGFDVSKLQEALSRGRCGRRAALSDFREKVTRAEKYSKILGSVSVSFPEIDIKNMRELLRRPDRIIRFEKGLAALATQIRTAAEARLSKWGSRGFNWGGLLDRIHQDLPGFCENFSRFEEAAAETSAWLDAARESAAVSRDPAFKAVRLALRNPMALDTFRTELTSLFESHGMQRPTVVARDGTRGNQNPEDSGNHD